MTNPVAIHLKDFDGRERIVLQAVVELEGYLIRFLICGNDAEYFLRV